MTDAHVLDASRADSPAALLLRRLELGGPLPPHDRDAVLDLPWQLRTLARGATIIREGEPPQHCAFLVDGFIVRQKLTAAGDRQIVALHIPGDPLDLQTLFLGVADHHIQTLTPAVIATVPRELIQALIAERAALARAVVISLLADASIGREWLLNTGRRDAQARLAHLLCEFACRMDAQGLTGDDGYELPMTQEQLGDTLGLTAVHVNRTLKALEAQGIIHRKGRRITFASWAAIRAVADFNPLYLHLHDTAPPDRPGG